MKREERRQLASVVGEIREIVALADSIRFLAAHLPVSGAIDPESALPFLNIVSQVVDSGDLDAAGELLRSRFFSGRKKHAPSHAAAERLTIFHQGVRNDGSVWALAQYNDGLKKRSEAEHRELEAAAQRLASLAEIVRSTFDDVTHMPIMRTGVLSVERREADEKFLANVEPHMIQVLKFEDLQLCHKAECGAAHRAAMELIALDKSIRATRSDKPILAARTQVKKQLREERSVIENRLIGLGRAQIVIAGLLASQNGAEKALNKRLRAMERQGVDTQLSSGRVRLLPVDRSGVDDLRQSLLSLGSTAPTRDDRRVLESNLDSANEITRKFSLIIGTDGDCRRDNSCIPIHDETVSLIARSSAIELELEKITPSLSTLEGRAASADNPMPGLHRHLGTEPHSIELVDGSLTARARKGLASVIDAGGALKNAVKDVRLAAERVHAADVIRTLSGMDLEVLKKAGEGAIRQSALSNAGLNSVYDVLSFGDASRLVQLDGIGESTAIATEQAARRLYEAIREETPVRIDVKRRDALTEKMLRALQRWHDLRKFSPSDDEVALAQALAPLLGKNPRVSHVLCYPVGGELFSREVIPTLTSALKRGGDSKSNDDIWKDFLSRPADYFSMLNELGYLTEDEAKMHGDLPEEIITAVRAVDLKRKHLTASLRTYQSFGARFALVQKRVVIGDEMGLGKTLEALALLAHLRATGHKHFLVVCPAAVVSNWVRETNKHTTLDVVRIHGPASERKQAFRSWMRKGGVAVTTFDLLARDTEWFRDLDIAATVFDEAHYIKNPGAKRSQASSEIIKSSTYVVLMTGTPLENKVQEFRNLIGYIRPDLAETAPEYLASRFRKHVAPVYLRRNQEDVLAELPERVDIDEWMGMSDSDISRYREAVEASNFMEMRRAAMLSKDSMKLNRLLEIVEEAKDNGRRVIVFSFFRDVLDQVASSLSGTVIGPMTGSVSANDRQAMVDRFSRASHGAVLVAQITAGGVGLNIQSASVVVICEPQLKPAAEDQAVARAHRMGQTEVVQVHRLLTENSVDERIRDLLKNKKEIFEEFARDSVIAKRATDAVDMTDTELARVVVAAERERLLGGQV